MDKVMIVSACLLGKKCRFDARDSKLDSLSVSNYNLIPVCPEEAGGLGTPRPCAELQHSADEIISGNGTVKTIDNRDITAQFLDGAQQSLVVAKENMASIAILKSKSPSCGLGKIYNGSFSGNLIKGNGVFAQMCLNHGIEVVSSEDLDNIKSNLISK